MAKCIRCGASYDYWKALKREFVHVCEACAGIENEARDVIRKVGPPALTQRYFPNTEFSNVALGVWSDSAWESAAGQVGAALLTGGQASGGTYHRVGFVGLAGDTVHVVTLGRISSADAFDYADINKHFSPPSFRRPDSHPLWSVATSFRLHEVEVAVAQGDPVALEFKGMWNETVRFPEAFRPGNRDEALAIAEAVRERRPPPPDAGRSAIYQQVVREPSLRPGYREGKDRARPAAPAAWPCPRCQTYVANKDWVCPKCGHTRWGRVGCAAAFATGLLLASPAAFNAGPCLGWILLAFGAAGWLLVISATVRAIRFRKPDKGG